MLYFLIHQQVSKKIDDVVTLLAKAPVSSLRSLITKHQPKLLPPQAQASDLESNIKSCMEALWSATGNWTAFLSLLHKEMDPIAAESNQWMRSAVTAANELTEARIKELIKSKGGGRVSLPRPKAKKGENGGKEAGLSKTDYLTVLVDLLRQQEENDYKKVALMLQKENQTAGKKKGFGK